MTYIRSGSEVHVLGLSSLVKTQEMAPEMVRRDQLPCAVEDRAALYQSDVRDS